MMGGTTWYLHGDNNSLLYEKELKANGVTENRHYLQAAGMTFAKAPGNLQSDNRYAHVMNNPLAYADPSGYIGFKKLLRIAVVVCVAFLRLGLCNLGRFSMGTASLRQKSCLVPQEAQRQAQQGPPSTAAQSEAS